MKQLYKITGIFTVFIMAFISLQSTAVGANEVCGPTTGTLIQLLDNDGKLKQTFSLEANSSTTTIRRILNKAITRVSVYPQDESNGKRGTVRLSKGQFTASAFIMMKEGVTLEGTVENDRPVTTMCTQPTSDAVTIKIMVSHTGVKNLILDGKRRTEDPRTGEPRNHYSARNRGVEVTAIDQSKSTADLVSVYSVTNDLERLQNILIEDVQITGYEGYGIYLEHVNGVTVKGSDSRKRNKMIIKDIGYAGIGGYSASNVTVRHTTVRDLGPGETVGNAKQSYGMAFSHRKDKAGDVMTQSKFPRSDTIVIDGNVVANNPSWEGIDTHSGHNVSFTNNVILNTRFPIIVGGLDYKGGSVSAYPPSNIKIVGNRINGESFNDYEDYGIDKNATVSERGITVNGTQFNDLSETEMGFLQTVVIKGNYVNNVQANVEEWGGISIHVTKNALIEGNTIENSFNNGIAILSSNKFTKLQGNIINHINKSDEKFIQAGIGIRGSHNNGSPTNDYAITTLNMENNVIERNNIFTEVGREIHVQDKTVHNRLDNWIAISALLDWNQPKERKKQ
ncbi:right-handed parallel beta-helix repeat-containing protein [Peribacillus sp. NJ11]|uniref:right-handed parallel beta-helix repeat-containing protein n=1 Tax=Peribacillus sp. NJ11 TaxID=3055861 RepID=UPI0025A28783|nr:right-handed parallel beta-helix repeat-containing protein [Peribacillus sp. NJ11]MDM5220304.1 right-handed parallel beta-helix repeat-containing protein [Peribacillus sp. NJ11]